MMRRWGWRAAVFGCLVLIGALVERHGHRPSKPTPVPAPRRRVAQPIVAAVPDYRVEPDFSNVANGSDLAGRSPEIRAKLAQNGFAALVAPYASLEPHGHGADQLPPLITVDLAWHRWHQVYDLTTAWIERARVTPLLSTLSSSLLDSALTAGRECRASDRELAASLQRVSGWAAVPAILLGQRPALPPAVLAASQAEVARVRAHAGREACVTGVVLDYSLFTVRGHYDRDPVLGPCFQALVWFGEVGFGLSRSEGLLDAAVVTTLLRGNPRAARAHAELGDLYRRLVGPPDDTGPEAFGRLVPARSSLRSRSRRSALGALAHHARELPAPRLPGRRQRVAQAVRGFDREFRLLPSRRLFDAVALSDLVAAQTRETRKALIPSFLDVGAALGGERARQLSQQHRNVAPAGGYDRCLSSLRSEFAASLKVEPDGIAEGWLESLAGLFEPITAGYPRFMCNEAWQDRQVVSAAASWSEMRHDAVAVIKQTDASAPGAAVMLRPPRLTDAVYVEPAPLVFERLADMAGKLLALMPPAAGQESAESVAYLRYLQTVYAGLGVAARAELANERLDDEALRRLKDASDSMWHAVRAAATLARGVTAGTTRIEDRDPACIADTASVTGNTGAQLGIVEDAVGTKATLWVIAPFDGVLLVFRGGVQTWHEFLAPPGERWTDDRWRGALGSGKAPPRPEWSNSYLLEPGAK